MPASEIKSDQAEAIALRALEFVIGEPDLQNKFIATSGLTAKAIHDSIQNKEFLGGVLDFLLGQEEELVKFCQKYECLVDNIVRKIWNRIQVKIRRDPTKLMQKED